MADVIVLAFMLVLCQCTRTFLWCPICGESVLACGLITYNKHTRQYIYDDAISSVKNCWKYTH